MTATTHAPITVTRHGDVQVLTLQAPPVNALGAAMRAALLAAWGDAERDCTLRALVITGAGKLFCGGADIGEFDGPIAEPDLSTMLTQIERGSLPIVAAINGAALGGGLELALVCDHRLAAQSAKLGLPEVSLGVIPGAGGTQRLPRLVGMEAAILLACGGKPVSAREAATIGLVDRVADDVVAEALALAQTLERGQRRTAYTAVPVTALSDEARTAQRASVAKAARRRKAPLAALECLLNAAAMPLDEGLAAEQAAFHACNAGSEAKALQHMFMAERKVAQIKGIGRDIPARPFAKVGVVGAGTMGSGIAAACLAAGLTVVLVDLNAQGLQRGVGTIRKIVEGNVAKGRITETIAQETLARLMSSDELASLAGVDVVIEAVFENLEVKRKLFADLDGIVREGAVLATNTSTLDVDAIALATRRPADVIGLHFFSPAHIMRLLEIVRGRETAPDVVKTALDLTRRIGKIGVVVGVCYGFVGNRMLEPYSREAHRLLLEGATPAQIDGVLNRFGMAMGVLSMCDMAGNDVGALMRQGNRDAIAQDPSYCRMGDVLAARGEVGQKASKGFYAYAGRDKSEREDLPALIAAEANALGITRRVVSDEEVFERCLFMLVNEGFLVLEEGIAQRPGDIDVIWCNGYGFPAHLGGPMHWAERQGLAHIHARLLHWREALGDYGQMWFTPSPALAALAANGATLSTLFPED